MAKQHRHKGERAGNSTTHKEEGEPRLTISFLTLPHLTFRRRRERNETPPKGWWRPHSCGLVLLSPSPLPPCGWCCFPASFGVVQHSPSSSWVVEALSSILPLGGGAFLPLLFRVVLLFPVVLSPSPFGRCGALSSPNSSRVVLPPPLLLLGGGASVNTTPNPRIRRTPAVIDSTGFVVSRKNSRSSHPAQHVARALVVVSFTLEHYLTFHMHFSPTFYPTIYQTFIDVHFTRRFYPAQNHRMCLSAPWLKRSRLQVMSVRISLKRATLYWSNRCSFLPQTEHDVGCWSAESIATLPPESDLDDEQTRNMLASPLYLQEREVSADRSRVYHSFRENSVSSPSHFRDSAGKPAAVFSHKRKSSQGTLSDRERISSGHQPVQGKGEKFFRFSDPEGAARLVLEEQRDHLPAKAKSEILKQECKDDLLNTSIREFQRQAHSNRLETNDVNYGYEESRREQARLHEELA